MFDVETLKCESHSNRCGTCNEALMDFRLPISGKRDIIIGLIIAKVQTAVSKACYKVPLCS